ncbi:MAG: type IV pilus assembly protein PilM [Candidatus Saccharibacteria bacterium]|nr:type IV pilus assembly protein PilM [Candidatus Saccharibacteria bacterium]
MSLLHGVGEFFSLDIGTNSMRIVQLNGNSDRGWSLSRYAYIPVTEQITNDNSEAGRRRLGEAIMGAVHQAGIKTKNVAIGLPSSRTFTSIVETATLPEKELEKTFRYEIDKYVPMPMSEAKADYIVLGASPNDPNKTEILVSSVAKDYAESTMETIEKTGLNIIAMEPEPLAMARALVPPGAMDAVMVVDFGEKSTDIVVVYRNQPRLVRSVPGGFGSFVQTLSSGLGVRGDQARQFILKFGLAEDKVEGQVIRTLNHLLESFASELIKSARFFQTKYVNSKIGGIVLSGCASIIPLFPEYIEARTNIPAMNGNPWQLVRTSDAQKRALMPVASEFAVAIGLSERSND